MDFAAARERLVERLAEDGRIDDDRVREAVAAVPRHEFVPAERREDAYRDTPLPIGEGQTISAPHMVAIMADLLDPAPGDDVLEVGTGCGYHAAVTAELVGAEHVFSVEYHDSLADEARERLDRLGYGEVSVRAGDGKDGWADHAPYDRAYLTCAGPELPEAVVEQVRPGGYLLAPIGDRRQTLVRARRRADGSLERDEHGGVRFVELQ
ncbi:protein-L-isoaspartate(D-aspartate) O-methyltransferase [Halosimplex pelagicum]|uniref:Protein-L-isoaspartate O-methyltransferase n=1 Tax=Halosimplex pelagicum TaxID=869886 RepID=A0A7D5P3S3_9EURY|nr:protein-L-isoaspartate(D-aspartate) O-methyltransferase [Halosimplex pelagicum]QLH80183.1 protein-L-isoaspartate(D-aspartate) O-methyltransferase [Halosimplex pelagicum]